MAGNVQVKLVGGIVTYVNTTTGQSESTGNTLSAYANSGIALSNVTGNGFAVGTLGTDLASFQTSGFLGRVNKPAAGIAVVDALGSSSAAIDAFVTDHLNAATGSLINASLNVGQYDLLYGNGTSTNYLAAGGVTALNAAGATNAQITTIITDSNAGASTLANSSVSNLAITSAQFGVQAAGGPATFAPAKAVTGGVTLDANLALAGGATGGAAAATVGYLMDVVTGANGSKVSAVNHVHLTQQNIADAKFATFVTKVPANGIDQVISSSNYGGITAVTAGTTTYAVVPTAVTFSAPETPGGVTATGTVALAGGAGTALVFTITNAGSGYANPPTITLTGGTVAIAGTDAAAVVNNGTNANVFTAADWNTMAALTDKILDGSIGSTANVNAVNLSVPDFITLKNEFASGSVNGLSLLNQTSANIDSVAAAATKLTAATVVEANVSAAQFSTLASKIAAGQATVNASGATDAQVTSLINNLTKFDNDLSTNGVPHQLSNLTINAAQFATLNMIDLADATPVNSAGALNIVAVDAATKMTVNATNFTNALTGFGSDVGDNFTFGGAATVNGAKGADLLDARASNTDVSLSGGNAADTIYGGTGNDTITGGKAGAAGGFNVLTGGAGIDTFNVNFVNRVAGDVSVNVITDLGAGGADKFVVDSGAVATMYLPTTAGAVVTYTATAGGAVNNGSTTIKNTVYTIGAINPEATNSGTMALDLTNATGTSGFSVVGGSGNDTVTGSLVADTINGGSGIDRIVGLSGADSLTGGAGVDTFVVSGSGTDVITDLGFGGADELQVAAGASVSATVTASWTAAVYNGAVAPATGTQNLGSATLTLANAVGVNLGNVTTGNGYTITAAGNSAGSSIVASAFADTITAGNGDDTIDGLGGLDIITLAAADGQVDRVAVKASAADAKTITGFVGGNIGGDIITAAAASYSAYSNAKSAVIANVATLSALANAGVATAGGANNTVAGVNYIVADTQANILAANLNLKFALTNGGGAANKAALAYATDTGNLYFDADANFASGAELVGNVASTGTWTNANFLIT